MNKEKYKFEILKKDNYHIYYEDRDDNAGGAIVYKNLKNNEFFEQSVKIENLIDFYNACELCVINFYHLLPFSKDKNDKNKHILLTDIKSLHADLNNTTSLDTFKLEAEHQAATAMVEANMAEFHAEQQELKEKEREEREALIAEAYKIAGKIEAFKTISNFGDIASLMLLKRIKESKVYKEMPTILTWENYCKSIGISRRKVDEDLENLNAFGEKFIGDIASLSLGYRELRQLKKQVKSGNLEVKDAEVIIDGEVIPLDDKDELRDALDTLLKSKYKEIEEKDKLLKDKEMQLEVVRETKDGFARRMDKAEEEAAKYKKEIEKLKNNKPSFKNVSDVDAEDFQKLLNLEQQWRDLFNALKNATDDDKLSSFNKSMLGGIVAQILLMLDDFRMQLNGKSEFYFHGIEMDEEQLNKQISPSDYLAMQNNK